jgi:hypothetical protein
MRKYVTKKFTIILLFIFCFMHLRAQSEFYNCPKEKQYEYVSNAKLIPKYALGRDSIYLNWKVDTGSSVVFEYQQRYDCSGTGHLGVIGSLLWSISKGSTQFAIQFNKSDSLQPFLVYITSCAPEVRRYNFQMVSVMGEIHGALVSNVWQVKGQITLQLVNREYNISTSKDLIVDGSYKLWKEKKDKKGHNFNPF